jgi:hypothetical protein
MLLLVASGASMAACVEHDNPPSAAALEKAAVLEVMDRYLAAISSSNLEAMKQLQMPEGMTYRAKSSADGSVEVIPHPNSWWVDPARKDGHALRERYWAPTVLVRGSIAVVWAPYEFWIDGKTSHCGIDSFDFVKSAVDGSSRMRCGPSSQTRARTFGLRTRRSCGRRSDLDGT